MQPFVLATGRNLKGMEETKKDIMSHMLADRSLAEDLLKKKEFTNEELCAALDAMIAHSMSLPAYINDTYQVTVEDPAEMQSDSWPDMVHLSIKRRDRDIIRDWRDLQEIKNLLVGPEHEGLEMFPAESRCVDSANQYHMFVFKDPTVRFPFGFQKRYVADAPVANTRQRKLGE